MTLPLPKRLKIGLTSSYTPLAALFNCLNPSTKPSPKLFQSICLKKSIIFLIASPISFECDCAKSLKALNNLLTEIRALSNTPAIPPNPWS